MSKVRCTLTIAAAVASVVALASSPASAAPNWQAWAPSGFVECGSTTHSVPSTKVIHQTCIIHNKSGNLTAQAVLLVRNNASVNITVDSARVVWDTGVSTRSSYCNRTVVSPGELTACYGETRYATPGDTARSEYEYNNTLSKTTKVAYTLY